MRGGQSKWTLKHLPEGTMSEFKEEVVPLARQLTGTLAPWAKMTSKQLQTMLDMVYGAGKCEGPFGWSTNYEYIPNPTPRHRVSNVRKSDTSKNPHT
ncbi:hypothetical protein B0H10DRAFT_2083832 [Mycena sp. CBHHK59/15]|nr:hypothetical protein B0H10DRAFT_2083832 [Mycena sp. CBHHK59/15]